MTGGVGAGAGARERVSLVLRRGRLAAIRAAALRSGARMARVRVEAAPGAQARLDATLHALRRSERRLLSIEVVGADESAELADVARRHRVEDPRVRLATTPRGADVTVRPGVRLDPGVLAALLLVVTGRVAAELLGLQADLWPRYGPVDNPVPDLPGWLAGVEEAGRRLDGAPSIYRTWCELVVSLDLPRFLDASERLTADQWTALHACVSRLTRGLDGAAWALLPHLTRTKVWLAQADRRADLEHLVVASRFDAGQARTRVDRGVVRAETHAGLPALVGVPDWCGELGAESGLRAAVRRAWWDGDRIELELFGCLRKVDTAGEEVAVRAWLVGGGRRTEVPAEVHADPAVTRWAGERFQSHDRGRVRVSLDPRAVADGLDELAVELELSARGLVRSGPVLEVERTGSFALFEPRRVGRRTVGLRHDTDRGLLLVRGRAARLPRPGRPAGVVEVVDVRVQGSDVHVGLRSGSRLADSVSLVLAGPRATLPGRSQPGPDGGHEVRFATTTELWGRPGVPAPAGGYRLRARVDGTERALAVDPGLARRLPLEVVSATHRVRVVGAAPDELRVVLGPPLCDDELGTTAQGRLQASYAAGPPDLDPGLVYLQAYTGQSATDSPLAVYHELRRRRPDLRLVWAVADRSAAVPEGAETVLWRSRAWHHVIRHATWIVTNIELEPWFTPHPEQVVVQTFHGHPSKAMGLDLWRSRGLTPSRIEQQLDRTSRKWTLLVTPSPEMDRHYREQYAYPGEILAAGYPRHDALTAPEAGPTRRRVRRLLGVAEGQRLVLYAPTWRDDLATNHRAALAARHLDVAELARELGPEHLVAVRGHRFHSSPLPGRDASGVVDVSDYPEVNDLLLACDALVLDYSSLRFDAAVIGRPMVFLVPDLEAYTTRTRGFLFPFAESAPGPLVSSTREVVEELRDLERLRASHAVALARFHERYNRRSDGRAAERVVDRLLGEG